MPKKPMKPCRSPGCPNLAQSGESYCDEHKQAHLKKWRKEYDDKRHWKEHDYSSLRWRRLRKMQLSREPLCRMCGAVAKIADHIMPRKEGGPDALYNLQSLCAACHNRKTARERKHE